MCTVSCDSQPARDRGGGVQPAVVGISQLESTLTDSDRSKNDPLYKRDEVERKSTIPTMNCTKLRVCVVLLQIGWQSLQCLPVTCELGIQ
ncbi:hypothetical protein GBAR_LOCUS3956 [Geodia barretti]|uniref:Uncharacterized protein n=1 Tax=Geodia barretti TaxID=519541 RepID=A0AA35R5E5_GEOBA|nr:hypothetical protein GBAR_LOCUS3956 [Geodia barretti]